jgi:hypothetical protein
MPLKKGDIQIFRNQVEQLIKDKYASRRFISVECAGREGLSSSDDKDTQSHDKNFTLEAEEIRERTEEIHLKSTFVARYPDQKATLMEKHCNQLRAARNIWDKFTIHERRGQLLLATTGAGKTYIMASQAKNFDMQKFIQKYQCYSPWPIIWITKSSIVEQTKGVLRDQFGLDVVNKIHVVNIEMLRSHLGKLFVKESLVVKQGQEHYVYKWNGYMHPIFFIWDECQILAREESTQSQIAQAVNDIEEDWKAMGVKVFQLFASATPFTRVSEAKVFAVSTGLTFKIGLQEVKLTNENWHIFARQIAAPSDPEEYCEAAVTRLMDVLDPYIERIKGIRPQHRAYNSINRIKFQTKEEAEEYEKAWTEYLEQKAKIEGSKSMSAAQSRFALLAQFTIFRKKAERIRAPHLAKFIYDTWNAGHAPAVAAAFKGTITRAVRLLIDDYNWTRDDISIIWGGSTEALTMKQKIAKKIKDSPEMQSILAALDLDLDAVGIHMKNLNEKTTEQYEFEKAHNLLTQKPEDREKERLRFQRQDSKCLLFSYKSGGVGLSAHHEIQYPKARPRRGIFTPVYSEKELIQALGRLPRITSISDTYQCMCYYGGTIEDAVAERVRMKLKCMTAVVKMKEDWTSLVTKTNLIEADEQDDDTEVLDAEGAAILGDYKESDIIEV